MQGIAEIQKLHATSSETVFEDLNPNPVLGF